MKRLVDLVDRGPQDDHFFPASANNTIFQRRWAPYHNAVPEVVEIGYLGHTAWGQRITIPLRHKDSGDLLQWICLRLKPRSWLGADLEEKIRGGKWTYTDPARAWMWAASLGTAAIQRVELEIGDAVVESWGGEWMDVWSRIWLDAGRAATWDSDIYGQVPVEELHSTLRPGWTTVQPTEDGYVYCWLPLTFLRRPQTAFPLVAVGETQEVRLHITLRPFADVVRRRAVPRAAPTEVPLGEVIGVQDVTGPTPVPYEVRLPTEVPTFEDATVFAGVVHLEDPLRSAYMRQALELIYEPITHMVFDLPEKIVADAPVDDGIVKMQLRLSELNGPIRDLCWFIRRKAVWGYNEWTNYGALLEDELFASIPSGVAAGLRVPRQEPLMRSARLMVGNAVWRDETEQWWRVEYGLEHRGGVRVAGGMVYGFVFGDAREWRGMDLQPAGTVNASRADLRLDLEITVPPVAPSGCGDDASGRAWEVHVFGVGLNWMRFVGGLAGPLFKD